MNQIKDLGVYKPLVVTKEGDNYITLGGNMRLNAFRELKIPEVMVSVVPAKTEALKLKYALSDNDRAGFYVDTDLAELVQINKTEIELSDYKIDLGEPTGLEDLLQSVGPGQEVIEDEPPPVPKTTNIKKGDLFQLENHKLLCEDSLLIDKMKIFVNNKAKITFTSPPYNIGKDLGSKHKNKTKYNDNLDNMSVIEYTEFLSHFTNCVFSSCSEYLFLNIQHNTNNKISIIDYLNQYKNKLVDICIWHKTTSLPSIADNVLNNDFEFVFILNNNEVDNRAIKSGNNFRGNISNVYYGNSNKNNEFAEFHRAVYPVQFVSHFIKNFTKENDIIFDPFDGVGTTIIACEQLNRICYAVEIDPIYCQLTINRWEKLTGKKAKKLN